MTNPLQSEREARARECVSAIYPRVKGKFPAEQALAELIDILNAALASRTPSPAPEGAAEPPIAWWSGGEYGGGDEHGRLSLGTFTEHEDTWHDIPVYAGWNNEGKPSRSQPPAASAGDSVLIKTVDTVIGMLQEFKHRGDVKDSDPIRLQHVDEHGVTTAYEFGITVADPDEGRFLWLRKSELER